MHTDSYDDLKLSEDSADLSIREIFRSLCENYLFIFGINTYDNTITIYRAPENIKAERHTHFKNDEEFNRINFAFHEKFLFSEDKERFKRTTAVSYVKERLKNTDAFTADFRISNDKINEFYWIRLKYSRMDNEPEPRRIAVGISDITEEKRQESDYYKAGKNILLVEDNEINLEMLATILEGEYPVLKASNGVEALEILKEKHEDIAIVISDMDMPLMNGFELLKTMKSFSEYSSIPVIIATGTNDEKSREECLLLGAADFITKPYTPVIIKSRVGFMIKYRESANMLHMLEKDVLTGLYTREVFYRKSQMIISQNPEKNYHIICSNVEGFRMINEKYGNDVGDSVLSYLAEQLCERIKGFVIGGRIGGDVYAFLCENEASPMDYDTIKKIRVGGPVPNLVVKYGVSAADHSLEIQSVCDHAQAAILKIKQKYGVYYNEYNDDIRDEMIRHQRILDEMDTALEQHQFSVYYQAKHNIAEGRTGGAEALVRWIHPDFGFMNPGDFIPLFEKNGFISRLDEYVFERVCEDIARWQKNGMPIVPVSVNLSRRDFDLDDLAERLIACTDKYGICHNLIHFEITESAFTDNPKKISKTVSVLHDAGFVIELDDFGAGYSSLTTLNSMDLDIIKIDMMIIREDVPGAERNVLDLCMNLAHMLKMKTVAEGVETPQQVERLRDLGCDYIQGYYYSKPLPVAAFEEYLLNN